MSTNPSGSIVRNTYPGCYTYLPPSEWPAGGWLVLEASVGVVPAERITWYSSTREAVEAAFQAPRETPTVFMWPGDGWDLCLVGGTQMPPFRRRIHQVDVSVCRLLVIRGQLIDEHGMRYWRKGIRPQVEEHALDIGERLLIPSGFESPDA